MSFRQCAYCSSNSHYAGSRTTENNIENRVRRITNRRLRVLPQIDRRIDEIRSNRILPQTDIIDRRINEIRSELLQPSNFSTIEHTRIISSNDRGSAMAIIPTPSFNRVEILRHLNQTYILHLYGFKTPIFILK
jgi:hypothetical protein